MQQTKHQRMIEYCDQALFSPLSPYFTLSHTHSPHSVKVKELERLSRDFSLGSDCPNSTSTRTCFVGDQQRNYSHLQTRNSHIRLQTHIWNTKRSPFFFFFQSLTQTEEVLQTPTRVHTEGERRWETENDWGRHWMREDVSKRYVDIISAG